MNFWRHLRLRRSALILLALLTVAAFLFLARASSNGSHFTPYFKPLFILNIVLICVLMLWVAQQLFFLLRAHRHGVFGSKLAVRLTIMCSLIALLPGVLVYASSIHFLGYSIESWFDVKLDRALQGGLSVSRSILDTKRSETVDKALKLASELSNSSNYLREFNTVASGANVDEADLYGPGGTLLAVAGEHPSLIAPAPLTRSQLRYLHENDQHCIGCTDPPDRSDGIEFRIILPLTAPDRSDMGFLQVTESLPASWVSDIETVENGLNDYNEAKYKRHSTRQLYTFTLSMALLVTLTFAFGLALMLAERFADPLGQLAKGTRAVAQGDFTVRQKVTTRDELGSLTESFNAMTAQLEQAKTERERNHRILETTRAYLESILSNLSSGVLVFDEKQCLRMVNQSASVLLQTSLPALIGVPLSKWAKEVPELEPFVNLLRARLEMGETGQWHQEVSLPVHNAERSLLMHGTRMEAGSTASDVIVVDDVTLIAQAQRDAAWSEVARRLAHEIKNPLTPIRLSAERLAKKLDGKLDSEDKALLERGTQTIVSQVGAMKHMVDDFAVYAKKTRVSQLVDVDLTSLLLEIADLYEHLKPAFHLNLPDAPVHILGEPVRLRQVFHNLLQNAEDAQAGQDDPLYDVTVALRANEVHIEFSDNGPGFPDDILARAFEPYVTTKAKGTGLGLAIVKKICEEHEGRVTIVNRVPKGCTISLIFPVREEKKAQGESV
jgi:nitrogen fixation/metabolism regulation signal transduction histidine kinase